MNCFRTSSQPNSPQQIIVKFFPILAKLGFNRWKGDMIGDVAGLVEIGMHDLLRGNRRIGKDLGKRTPSSGL